MIIVYWRITIILAALLFSTTAVAEVPLGLDGVLKTYDGLSIKWGDALKPLTMTLFWTLALVDITWSAFCWVKDRKDVTEVIAGLVQKIMTLGFFFALVYKAEIIIPSILSLFTDAGSLLLATGGATKLTPNGVITEGFNVIAHMTEATKDVPWYKMFISMYILVAMMAVMFTYVIIAGQLFIAIVEIHILAGAGVILLGFSGSRWTTDMATSYLKAGVSTGVKIMVVYVVVDIGVESLGGFRIRPTEVFNDINMMMMQTLLFCYLSWSIPSIAASMLSGSSSATLGGAVGAALTGAAAVAGVGGAGKMIADKTGVSDKVSQGMDKLKGAAGAGMDKAKGALGMGPGGGGISGGGGGSPGGFGGSSAMNGEGLHKNDPSVVPQRMTMPKGQQAKPELPGGGDEDYVPAKSAGGDANNNAAPASDAAVTPAVGGGEPAAPVAGAPSDGGDSGGGVPGRVASAVAGVTAPTGVGASVAKAASNLVGGGSPLSPNAARAGRSGAAASASPVKSSSASASVASSAEQAASVNGGDANNNVAAASDSAVSPSAQAAAQSAIAHGGDMSSVERREMAAACEGLAANPALGNDQRSEFAKSAKNLRAGVGPNDPTSAGRNVARSMERLAQGSVVGTSATKAAGAGKAVSSGGAHAVSQGGGQPGLSANAPAAVSEGRAGGNARQQGRSAPASAASSAGQAAPVSGGDSPSGHVQGDAGGGGGAPSKPHRGPVLSQPVTASVASSAAPTTAGGVAGQPAPVSGGDAPSGHVQGDAASSAGQQPPAPGGDVPPPASVPAGDAGGAGVSGDKKKEEKPKEKEPRPYRGSILDRTRNLVANDQATVQTPGITMGHGKE